MSIFHRRLFLSLCLIALLGTGFFWYGFLVGQRHALSTGFVVVFSAAMVVIICSLGAMARTEESVKLLLFALALGLLDFFWFFSYTYWNYGTSRNFSEPLTRLDALYFALGTFSTAGTGNISAISAPSRGIQAVQMTLDSGLVVFVAGALVARYMSVRGKSHSA